MTLSKESIDALSDLIENRLSIMHIGDRDDLRERVALERALSELQGPNEIRDRMLKRIGHIPHRGRRRKVSEMMGENEALSERA